MYVKVLYVELGIKAVNLKTSTSRSSRLKPSVKFDSPTKCLV